MNTANDRKTFAIEKAKKNFDKLSIPEQFDAYVELGKHIHQNNENEQKKLRDQADELQKLKSLNKEG